MQQVNLIRSLVKVNTVRSRAEITSKAQRNAAGLAEDPGEEPIEGGPKTAEVAVEEVSSAQLLSEIHILPDLTEAQQKEVEHVVRSHQTAFRLDGRLGNHPGLVNIPLRSTRFSP